MNQIETNDNEMITDEMFNHALQRRIEFVQYGIGQGADPAFMPPMIYAVSLTDAYAKSVANDEPAPTDVEAFDACFHEQLIATVSFENIPLNRQRGTFRQVGWNYYGRVANTPQSLIVAVFVIGAGHVVRLMQQGAPQKVEGAIVNGLTFDGRTNSAVVTPENKAVDYNFAGAHDAPTIASEIATGFLLGVQTRAVMTRVTGNTDADIANLIKTIIDELTND